VVGRAGRNGIGLAAAPFHFFQRVFPAAPEPDVEPLVDQPHVGAHQPAHHDVADPVVHRIGIVHPVFLHQHAGQAQLGGHRRHHARVVGLDAAYRDQRVATLFQGLRNQVFQLAQLVAAERQAAVAVFALCVDLDLAAQVRREAVELFDGGIAEGQAVAGKSLQIHAGSCWSSRAGRNGAHGKIIGIAGMRGQLRIFSNKQGYFFMNQDL
jgi:hypothetical protein